MTRRQDRLRVLFVTHAYPRHSGDAAGSFLHRLAVALSAEDVDVRVLAPTGPGLAAEGTVDGIVVRRFRYAPRGMETLAYTGTMAEQVRGSVTGKLALAALLAAGTLALRREVSGLEPHAVHVHWWFPGGLLALGGAGRRPVLLTMHGSDVRLAHKVPLAHPVFRRVLARAAESTAVSSWLAEEARTMAPKATVEVAPMPVDTAAFTHAVEQAATRRSADRFLFVGRLNAQKGIDDLLVAFAALPPHARLEVIGTGDLDAAMRSRAGALGCADRIVWRGHVSRDALPAAYAGALAVVIPSREEGLGLVAAEAQLCGTPVIAYASGGITDVVRPEWGGSLVPAGDTTGLANAMRQRLELGVAASTETGLARARMLERFAPAVVAAGYAARYRRIASHD